MLFKFRVFRLLMKRLNKFYEYRPSPTLVYKRWGNVWEEHGEVRKLSALRVVALSKSALTPKEGRRNETRKTYRSPSHGLCTREWVWGPARCLWLVAGWVMESSGPTPPPAPWMRWEPPWSLGARVLGWVSPISHPYTKDLSASS